MIGIFGIGSISTLLILLMSEVFFAQALTNTIIDYIEDNTVLFIIIMGLFFITIVVSFIVGFFLSKNIKLKSVRNASVLSLGCLFLFLFVVCNGLLYLNYKDIYVNIYGFDILWTFPEVIVLFSIYILNDVFNLFILTIITYYVFFVFFLEQLYIEREVY